MLDGDLAAILEYEEQGLFQGTVEKRAERSLHPWWSGPVLALNSITSDLF